MPPTEMAHTGDSLSPAQPTTPPSSPNLPSSEHIVTLSNVQQFIDMVEAVVAMQIASPPVSKCACSHTPAETPTLQVSAQPLTVEHLEQLILTLIEAKSPDSAGKFEGPVTVAPGDKQPEDVAAQVSRLEFKTVDELYVSNNVPVPSQLTSTLVQLGREDS